MKSLGTEKKASKPAAKAPEAVKEVIDFSDRSDHLTQSMHLPSPIHS